jgi:hypothetical protein
MAIQRWAQNENENVALARSRARHNNNYNTQVDFREYSNKTTLQQQKPTAHSVLSASHRIFEACKVAHTCLTQTEVQD